jgi:Tfp pilus assembly protein PilE
MLKSKKGITLVELIISVAFTSIIIAASCSVMFLGEDFFKSGTKSAMNQQNAALAEDYIRRYAAVAFKLSEKSDKLEDCAVFTLDNNVLNIECTSPKDTVKVDEIDDIQFKIENNLLKYTIESKDKTYKLSGAVIMNNFETGDAPASLKGNNKLYMYLS